MATTHKSTRIIRALITVTGKGTTLFSDRIKGGRSIKVWGWTKDHYEVAIQALAKQGISARLVNTPMVDRAWTSGGELRIHTTETAA